MFRFEHEIYLYGLLAIPFFLILFFLWRSSNRKKIEKLGNPSIAKRLLPDISTSKPIVKFILLCFAYSFILIGAANPQLGSKVQKIKREGVEIMIVLDVSNSMLAEDVKPNRLERAKQSIVTLINSLTSDKIGLVVFAGESYLQFPMTTDYSIAKLILSNIGTWMMPTQGTALGKAIEMGIEGFSDDKAIGKSLIIISDGENHEDDALSAASKAKEKGIIINTIGIGSISGAPIPLRIGKGYLKKDGKVVISKMNPDILKEVSKSSGGKFMIASSSDLDLSRLLTQINGMNKSKFGTQVITDYDDKFQYFLAAALFFILIESVVNNRFNRLFRALNKFIEGT